MTGIPMILDDVEAMAAWFIERHRTTQHLPTFEEFATAEARLGRNSAPDLLVMLDEQLPLSPGFLGQATALAWQAAEYPTRLVDVDTWTDLFGRAGFTRNGSISPRALVPVVAYRGAVQGQERGWSWTTDLAVAQWFASRYGTSFGPAHVYVATIPPDAQLAEITGDWEHGRTGESELIANPDSLDIRTYTPRSAA